MRKIALVIITLALSGAIALALIPRGSADTTVKQNAKPQSDVEAALALLEKKRRENKAALARWQAVHDALEQHGPQTAMAVRQKQERDRCVELVNKKKCDLKKLDPGFDGQQEPTAEADMQAAKAADVREEMAKCGGNDQFDSMEDLQSQTSKSCGCILRASAKFPDEVEFDKGRWEYKTINSEKFMVKGKAWMLNDAGTKMPSYFSCLYKVSETTKWYSFDGIDYGQ